MIMGWSSMTVVLMSGVLTGRVVGQPPTKSGTHTAACLASARHAMAGPDASHCPCALHTKPPVPRVAPVHVAVQVLPKAVCAHADTAPACNPAHQR